MSRKQKRLAVIAGLLAVAGAAIGLILYALNDNIVFFYSPSEMKTASFNKARTLRIGGLVAQNSVKRDGTHVSFTVTDTKTALQVDYNGPLPDLFREGQGIVAEGRLENGVFHATSILAKHDETYMPREVADALKKQGYWRHAEQP